MSVAAVLLLRLGREDDLADWLMDAVRDALSDLISPAPAAASKARTLPLPNSTTELS
jgi:hypothetical protein